MILSVGVRFRAVTVWATLVESTPLTAVPTAVHWQHAGRRRGFLTALPSPGRPLRAMARLARRQDVTARVMLTAVSWHIAGTHTRVYFRHPCKMSMWWYWPAAPFCSVYQVVPEHQPIRREPSCLETSTLLQSSGRVMVRNSSSSVPPAPSAH